MSRHMLRRAFSTLGLLLLVSLLLATAPSLMAQTASTGALTGRVTDSSGAVVPNATVTITSADTAQSRTAMTGADGVYKFNLLAPGNYAVKIEAMGFNAVEIPSATILVTETEVLDRALAVGATTQTITVEGSVETVQTTSSALGAVITSKTVTELPLNTRNYTNLLSMSAGANANVANATQVGKGVMYIAVNGSGFGQNNYSQDGVDITSWFSFNTGQEAYSGGSFAIPNPDAISEFKIQTSSYDAGYGRNPGANVNVITKSGTNNLHGAAFEFFRNTSLNANSWFNNYFGQPKGVLNSNQYGGTLGGPIKKDKLFFFVSYQETNQKNGISAFGQSSPNLPPVPTGDRGTCPVPTSADQLVANQAAWLQSCNAAAQAFVPALAANMCNANKPTAAMKTFQTNNNTGIQIQCDLSTTPLANINPVAISILQLKLPNGGYLIPSSGIGAGATAAYLNGKPITDPATFADHAGLGNWDYVINSKHTFSGRYEYDVDPLTGAFPSLDSNSAVGVFLPGSGVQINHHNQSAILKLTSILTPNVVNQANVAYQRLVTQSTELTPFMSSQVGISPVQGSTDNQLAYVTTGQFSFGAYNNFNVYNPVNQFQANDQLSWEHGKHSIRFGISAEHVQAQTFFPGHAVPSPAFATVSDFLIGRASCQAFTGGGTCGPGGPGGVVGGAGTFGDTNGFTASNSTAGGTSNAAFSGYYRVNVIGAFVQDDIKVNPRLTVNVGVRWEYDGNITEGQGLESSIWPSLLSTVPLPGSTPATGTLAGFVVPANYPGAPPPGVFVNSNNGLTNPNAPKDNFAPRLGVAWQPTASNRWVVRAGAGFFYDATPGNSFLNVLETTPPTQLASASPVTLATLAVPFVPQTPNFPGPPGTAGWTTRWVDNSVVIPGVCPKPTTTPCSSNLNPAAIPPSMTVPLMYEWNLNTQYEFRRNWVLEVAYVGSHGIHQLPQSRANLQGQGGSQIGYNLAPLYVPGNPAACPSCVLTGATSNTAGNAILRVPYLGISPTSSMFFTNGEIKFNGAEVTVRKQLSNGLQLQAAYTFSRGFDTQPFGINTAPYIVQAYEPNNNYHPNRFVVNYVWALPVPKYDGIKGKLLDDWTWTGVTTIQDGVPLSITDTGGSVFFGGVGSSSTAQLCPGMSYSNLQTSGSMDARVTSGLTLTNGVAGPGYLNGKNQGVLCATPTVGQIGGTGGGTGFGNIGGGAVLGPPQNNWDMSIAKLFPIRESRSLQFRAEYFNTFNHPQFNIPVLTANTASFGEITTQVVAPRVIQLALKFLF